MDLLLRKTLRFFSISSVTVICLFFLSACADAGKTAEGVERPLDKSFADSAVSWQERVFTRFTTAGYILKEHTIKKNEHFAAVLQRAGVSYDTIHRLIRLSEPVFDLKKLRAGNTYRLYFSPLREKLACMIYEESPRSQVLFVIEDSLAVCRYEIPLEIKEKTIGLTLCHSLWADLETAGYNPLIANKISEIYAWTIDFFALQKGDAFALCYDAYCLQGREVEAGPVKTAVFLHNGVRYKAYRFMQDSLPGYWDQNGVNLQKAFLKAPLKYSRISSGFSYARRHPITRKISPHTGVDYAAPYGTPVVSIGDGKVIQKAYRGAGGNTVKIKHNAVYTTAYLHLSRYAKSLYVGKQVAQGEVIAYVGSTGRSTGPHLDFRVWKNGTPVNPLTMEAPPAKAIESQNRERFCKNVEYLDRLLSSRAFDLLDKPTLRLLFPDYFLLAPQAVD